LHHNKHTYIQNTEYRHHTYTHTCTVDCCFEGSLRVSRCRKRNERKYLAGIVDASSRSVTNVITVLCACSEEKSNSFAARSVGRYILYSKRKDSESAVQCRC
jgi:hypothetical protein